MGVDLYIYVETRSASADASSATLQWHIAFQRATTCADCEGTGIDPDFAEESTQEPSEDDVCLACFGIGRSDSREYYQRRDHALYALFGYGWPLKNDNFYPYPQNRGFPPNSEMKETDVGNISWSFMSGTEFLAGPCEWNCGLTRDDPSSSRQAIGNGMVLQINWCITPYSDEELRHLTVREAFSPLIRSGFAPWIESLVAQYGGENVRISWHFA